MLETDFLVPIIILLGTSAFISTLVSIFKIRFLPTFVIEIVVGMLIGIFYRTYFHDTFATLTSTLYIIGFSLIMFLSGYDVNLTIVKDKVRSSLQHINVGRIAVWILIAVYVLAAVASLLFMPYYEKPIFGMTIMTIVLASTFAGVVAPLVYVEKLGQTGWGTMMITFSFLSELVSIILLTIYMIVNKITVNFTWSYFIIIAVFALLYVLLKIRKGRRIEEGMVFLTTKIIMVGLAVSVFLSSTGGGEYVLGAFLLGLFLKAIHLPHEKMKHIESFSYGIFIPMFFILVGMRIEIVEFFKHPQLLLLVLLLFAAFMLVKLPLLYLLRWYSFRTVLISIILSSCTLVVAITAEHIGTSLGIFSVEFGEAIILASILTAIVAPIVYEVGCVRSLRYIRSEEKGITYGQYCKLP